MTTTSKHDHPVTDNVMARQFETEAPNKAWADDLTYLPTKEGWLYLSVLIDLFSRRVVGWAMGEHLTTSLPLAALDMANKARQPPPGLLHQSDRGPIRELDLPACPGSDGSRARHEPQSRKGDYWDNAVVESFFATLKRELLDG